MGTGARGGSHRPRAELEVIEDGHLFMWMRPHENSEAQRGSFFPARSELHSVGSWIEAFHVTENVLGTIITLKEAESTMAVPVFHLACSHFFAQF